MTQVNFRVEDDVKANAEKALKEMGLTMSTAINMFLIKVGREKRIPFEINADPFYSSLFILTGVKSYQTVFLIKRTLSAKASPRSEQSPGLF